MPTIDPRRPCYPLDFGLLITSGITDPGDVGIFVARAEQQPAQPTPATGRTRAARAVVTAARGVRAPVPVPAPAAALDLPYMGWVVIQRGAGGAPTVLVHGGLDDHSVGPFLAEAFARVRSRWPGAPVRSV